jgi:hypothetical protein
LGGGKLSSSAGSYFLKILEELYFTTGIMIFCASLNPCPVTHRNQVSKFFKFAIKISGKEASAAP